MVESILIVEDDLTFGKMLEAWFAKKGFNVQKVGSCKDAKKKFEDFTPEVVITDLRLPKEDGLSLLAWIKSNYPDVVVIMMTGYADIQSAVSAIKLGAYDYISKPFNPDELFHKINDAYNQKIKDNPKLEKPKESDKWVRGTSPEYLKLYEYLDLVAPTDMSVLIKGESGVGKEHLARMIHDKSKVAGKPFVAVDCGVLSKELAASDLFGHVKGAFTGALTDKAGAFVNAHKGTLFLDEIGNLPMEVQVQLLRALQEKKVKPVGSDKEIKVDVRIIAATNEDIEFAVNNGYFRGDLFHRVCEFILEAPPLRMCKSDIPHYLDFFLKTSNRTLKKKIKGFTPEAKAVFVEYDWPGNIREMKNVINRLTLICQEKEISADIIPTHFKKIKFTDSKTNIVESLEEKQRIKDALRITNNNIIRAASMLNIDTKHLYSKMKLYNISYA